MPIPLLLLTALVGGADGGGQGISPADVDSRGCALVRRIEEQTRPRLPEITDPVTRLDSLTVDCGARLVVWQRTLTVNPESLSEGWRERLRTDWNADVCETEAFRLMIANSWRFVDRYRFSNGAEAVFEARCAQPSRLSP